MADQTEKQVAPSAHDAWEAVGCSVRLTAQPEFSIAWCATGRGAARIAAALNAAEPPTKDAVSTIDALREALRGVNTATEEDGPCWCVGFGPGKHPGPGSHSGLCHNARRALRDADALRCGG